MKKEVMIFAILFSIIAIAWLVSAVAGDGVKIISPTSGTNHTTSALFNVSYTNASDITSPLNATFYTNISGSWVAIGNTSATDGCTISSCAVTLPTSSLTDGTHSINATLFNGTSSAAISIINSTNLSTIIIDNTPPAVQEANFTSPLSSSNHSNTALSGNLTLNISVIDATIGINTVFFNITNSTGVQNATYTASQESSSSNYATSLDTRHFPDGTYNITAYVNDTLGNLNNSALVYSIIFDNTDPNADASCSSTSIDKGDAFPCSCSGTDATSGVRTSSGSSTSPDGTSTQTQTGTFTYTCTVTDYAGNSDADSIQYSVSSGSSPNSGSSGSSSTQTWTTYSVNDAEFESGHTRQLSANSRLKVQIENEDHYIGVKEISSNSATIEISSEPQQVTMSEGETKKFEVTDDSFYDIQITLNSLTSTKAEITLISIHEEIPETLEEESELSEETPSTPGENPPGPTSSFLKTFIIILIIIGAIAFIYFAIKKGNISPLKFSKKQTPQSNLQ